MLPSPCLQLPCPHQHAGLSLVPSLQQHAWFLGLGPLSQLQEVHRYKSTSPSYSPRRPSYTLYAPTSPYSRPHEPEHSPASFKSSTSKQISCTSRLLHPPRFVRTPDSSVFDSSTLLGRQRHAPRPTYSSSLPKHKGSAATSDTTTPNHAYNSPSLPPPVASTPSGTFGA